MKRAGITTGDVVILLAVLTLLAALAAPLLRARAFRVLTEETVAEVESVRASAVAAFGQNGMWPTPGDRPTGVPEVRIEWRVFEAVEKVEPSGPAARVPDDADAPPNTAVVALVDSIVSFGGILLHSSDALLLGVLLDRFGRDVSFVRDTTWSLIVQPPLSSR